MAAVIVVFAVWFGLVVTLGALAVLRAEHVGLPSGCERARTRFHAAVDSALAPLGRGPTSILVLLASWSAVIIIGWVLGLGAHRLEGTVDRPAFRWWQSHHLGGIWSDVWWKLTNIGSPTVSLLLTVAGAVFLAVVYRGRQFWWAPSITLVLGYFAERYSQIILKLVVHRGHPPTTLGTWPSGGMGRLIDLYGLIIYFVILRWSSAQPRAWAAGGTVLALAGSVQAYARINNLEHWLTDVIGGAVYGLTLLAMMILFHAVLTRPPANMKQVPHVAGSARGAHRRVDSSVVS